MGKSSNDTSLKNRKQDESSSDESDFEEMDRKYGNRPLNKSEFKKFVQRIFSSKIDDHYNDVKLKTQKDKKKDKKKNKKYSVFILKIVLDILTNKTI